ncbi:MAG: hypothetical protein H6709_10135 [Kofleriaceae bacterium]|nr:hypothetical protein [Kofleriaceae bacterium]
MGNFVCRGARSAGALLSTVVVAALAAPAAAGPHGPADADVDVDVADVDPALAPVRWSTGDEVGGDRSGDLRPEAAALLDVIASTRDVVTLGDARALGLAPPRAMARAVGGGDAPAPGDVSRAYDAPPTIRVWRRGVDGSTASCSGRVDVIPFETYVKGVLPHEWIRSWDAESLKAGAVAIRTYASAWVNSGGKYSCADLDDTTASQVYKDEFFAVTDAAVDATAAQYVVKDGDLVFAEYSAENGDPTAFGVDEPHCAGHAVNGHGRGTCQWGTQRWAQAGQTYDWMMRHYYPGAIVDGGIAYDASAGAADVPTAMVSGEEAVVWFEFVNDSTVTWDLASTLLGTAEPQDRDSAFFVDGNWPAPNRATGPDHSNYAPGTTGRFTFAIRAPEVTEPTTFDESFQLVQEGVTWFGPVVHMTITVSPRQTGDGTDPGGNPGPNGDGSGSGDGSGDGAGLDGGCAAGGGAAATLLPVGLALGLVLRRRRRAAAVAAAVIATGLMLGCAAPGGPERAPGARGAPLGGDSHLVALFTEAGARRAASPPSCWRRSRTSRPGCASSRPTRSRPAITTTTVSAARSACWR